MPKKKQPDFTILIESILGGHSPASHFAAPSQFLSSLGIDPHQPVADSELGSSIRDTVSSGLLRPTAVLQVATNLPGAPLWFPREAKATGKTYMYLSTGSAYSLGAAISSATPLSDGGALSNSTGNGAEYYDNYIYFAKNSTVARYGPLDGAPAFDGDYWGTTLGKTYLTNTGYPITNASSFPYCNHVMHRHSDGRLYFPDVVDNKGVIHYIQTTKTTTEGDTDNGSKYNALQFGYGLWPTAIESYGSDLAIALYEGPPTNGNAGKPKPAKLAFWDTTSGSFNKIIFVEFPDAIISGMININGVLYIVSGNVPYSGFRVSRFVGGYTVEEVGYFETGSPPFNAALDGTANNLIVGVNTAIPENAPAVLSLGLQKSALGKGLFNIQRASTGNASSHFVSALKRLGQNMRFDAKIVGWTDGVSSHGLDLTDEGEDYSINPSVWWSQIYKIGRPFKITKIRIPLAQAVNTSMIVTPKIYLDEGEEGVELTPINDTYFNGKKNAVIRPNGLVGQHNFFLELRWTGQKLCTVGLPITIEGEYAEED